LRAVLELAYLDSPAQGGVSRWMAEVDCSRIFGPLSQRVEAPVMISIRAKGANRFLDPVVGHTCYRPRPTPVGPCAISDVSVQVVRGWSDLLGPRARR
jgi:hypothetical protein